MTTRRPTTAIVALILTSFALVLSGLAPATAATTGAVKGVVISAGQPIAGLTVQLMRSDTEGETWTRVATDTTDAKGAYAFTGVKISEVYHHLVRISDSHGRYVTTDRSFTPRSGRTVTRNATVKPAGFLTGKVFRADGASPTTTRVHLIGPDVTIGDPDQNIKAYDTDRGVKADGTYRFAGLPAGDYTVRYTDTSRKYLDQCYDGVLAKLGSDPTCDSTEVPAAKVVTVAAKATSTLTDQTLTHAGARLSGTVTSTAGSILKGIDVTPVPQGSDSRDWYDYAKATGSAGTFSRGSLSSGQWQLYAEDSNGVWASQWVGGTNQATAQVFDLSAGETIDNIAIKLKSRAVLSVKTTTGSTRATFVVSVSRKVTGSAVSGKVSAALAGNTKTATLSGGKATITLTGLTAGKHTFRIHFEGNGNTSTGTKNVTATVG
ncbi:hypothetical protein [Aeromicrobium sp. 9AM]|uniref:hypothetical protein n=1 Tax=Aeromicrobium sp. 9AM TaxID=2653126 RepID=UPI0012F1AE78|nr:hypothetical protein [Aeromicrobium sp. 9AM]VXC45497.1 conserved exported hypothetical protein [Aeromicrobium sp. 9AM]